MNISTFRFSWIWKKYNSQNKLLVYKFHLIKQPKIGINNTR
jgi:hypothetical protein